MKKKEPKKELKSLVLPVTEPEGFYIDKTVCNEGIDFDEFVKRVDTILEKLERIEIEQKQQKIIIKTILERAHPKPWS